MRTEGWNEPPGGRFGKTQGRLASWRSLASLRQASELLNHQEADMPEEAVEEMFGRTPFAFWGT